MTAVAKEKQKEGQGGWKRWPQGAFTAKMGAEGRSWVEPLLAGGLLDSQNKACTEWLASAKMPLTDTDRWCSVC